MRLKQKRQEYNLSQTDLAKKVGLSQKSISNYEKGLSDPDIKTLIKLADYFHITVDSLIEHNVPYLFDKSILGEQCQKVIDKVCKLSERQCELVDTYIIGMMTAEEEKQNIIRKFKGE